MLTFLSVRLMYPLEPACRIIRLALWPLALRLASSGPSPVRQQAGTAVRQNIGTVSVGAAARTAPAVEPGLSGSRSASVGSACRILQLVCRPAGSQFRLAVRTGRIVRPAVRSSGYRASRPAPAGRQARAPAVCHQASLRRFGCPDGLVRDFGLPDCKADWLTGRAFRPLVRSMFLRFTHQDKGSKVALFGCLLAGLVPGRADAPGLGVWGPSQKHAVPAASGGIRKDGHAKSTPAGFPDRG